MVADAGLGLRRLGRALRSAGPDHVIGDPRGLLLAPGAAACPGAGSSPGRSAGDPSTARRGARWPTSRGSAGRTPPAARRRRRRAVALHLRRDRPGQGRRLPAPPAARPARGRPRDLRHRPGRPAGRGLRAVRPLGPALGIASAVPDIDVTAPGTLTAGALADAVAAVDATVVFASPAALRNVVATAPALDARSSGRRSAGSGCSCRPVRRCRPRCCDGLARAAAGRRAAHAVRHDRGAAGHRLSLAEIEAAGAGDGVCVGRPLAGVEVAAQPARRATGAPTGAADRRPGCHRRGLRRARRTSRTATTGSGSPSRQLPRPGLAPHRRRRAPRRRRPAVGRGPAGARDHAPPTGPVTPVGIEQRVEALAEVAPAAVVGVGPAGTQQVVVVVVTGGRGRRRPLAADGRWPRRSARRPGAEVAAVLVADALPIDIRHASKIDRTRGRRAGPSGCWPAASRGRP